jgi:MFS family permease
MVKDDGATTGMAGPFPTPPKNRPSTADTAPRSDDGYRKYFMSLLALTALMNILDRQIFSILLEPIKHDLHLSDTQLGFITGGAFAIVYTVAGFPIGYISDKGGRRVVLASTLMIWSAMTMLCGFARSHFTLLLARMGVGVGEAGSLPATMSAIADIYPPEKRSGAIGLIYAFGTAGSAIAMAAGGYLETVVGWRVTLMIVGVPGLLLGLLFFFTTSEPKRSPAPAKPQNILESVRHVFRVPTFRCMIVMCTLFVFISSAIVNWTPTFLIRVHHMPTAQVGWALGLTGLAGGLGSFLSGRFSDRLARGDVKRLMMAMILGPLVALPVFLFFLYSASASWAIGSFFIVQFCMAAYLGPSYALIISVAPSRSRALSIAIIAFFQNLLGYTMGPVVVGILNDVFQSRYGQNGIRISLAIVSFAIVGIVMMAVVASRYAAKDIASAEQG